MSIVYGIRNVLGLICRGVERTWECGFLETSDVSKTTTVVEFERIHTFTSMYGAGDGELVVCDDDVSSATLEIMHGLPVAMHR